MYKIIKGKDIPDIEWMVEYVRSLMRRGVYVGNLESIVRSYKNKTETLKNIIISKYGILNPNSSQQISRYLESLGDSRVYEVCFINGKWTTGKEVLADLEADGYEFASDILEYRKAKKYLDSIKAIHDAADSNGFIHPIVNTSKTNRINYREPALMNIPKELLWDIVKPSDNNKVLVSADIKNQEPNILINMLNIESLKPALRNPGGLYEYIFGLVYSEEVVANIYVGSKLGVGVFNNMELAESGLLDPTMYIPRPSISGCSYYNGELISCIDTINIGTTVKGKVDFPEEVLIETINGNQYRVGVEWEKPKKASLEKQGIIQVKGYLKGIVTTCEGVVRKEFKTAWNAMTYGASLPGIKAMCKHIDGELVYKYFNSIPEFKKYKSLCKKAADNKQQSARTYFGTIVSTDEINRQRLQRILMDLPVQGTGSDILSLLLMHIEHSLSRDGLSDKIRVVFPRHDEVIFEVDKDILNNAIGYIQNMVTHSIDNWEPFKVEVAVLGVEQ